MWLMRLFSRKWIAATLLAMLAVGVMIRLGIWQLDRLEQRRALNARVVNEINEEQLELTADNLTLNFEEMEYRKVVVTGRYDFYQEVALRNQVWNDQIGVHLLTPLIISGTNQAVIIDRGWIPQDAYLTGDWSDFAEDGEVTVQGIIRRSQPQPDFGRITDQISNTENQLTSWNLANIPEIAKQLPYNILPIYIQQSPADEWTILPYRSLSIPEISEGSHFSYALQWFTFATILAVGYPIMVRNDKKNH